MVQVGPGLWCIMFLPMAKPDATARGRDSETAGLSRACLATAIFPGRRRPNKRFIAYRLGECVGWGSVRVCNSRRSTYPIPSFTASAQGGSIEVLVKFTVVGAIG